MAGRGHLIALFRGGSQALVAEELLLAHGARVLHVHQAVHAEGDEAAAQETPVGAGGWGWAGFSPEAARTHRGPHLILGPAACKVCSETRPLRTTDQTSKPSGPPPYGDPGPLALTRKPRGLCTAAR